MSDHSHDTKPEGSSTFLIGAVVGAAVTYLFTTKSGQKIKKELIRDVLGALEGIGDNLEEKEKEAKAELDSVEKQLEEKKEDIQEKIEDVKEEVKQKVEEKKQEVQENLVQTQESVQKEVQQTKQEAQQVVTEVPKQVAQIQKKGRNFFFRKRHHRGES